MKNIYPNIKRINNKSISIIVNYLKKNNIVGLPTETVYGVAGNAYSKKAIKSIYKLKKRPKKNPLIIHYYTIKDINNDVEINSSFKKLYKRFCPGPITFVLKKKKTSKINRIATANLNTVAIRFPSHKQTRKVLKKLNFPLAMPSANKSAGLSPVTAEDVYEEFKNKISLIVDGGKCKIGIESTVVDLTNNPQILRPGIIDKSKIEKTLKLKVSNINNNKKNRSPGMMKKHYSPGIPVLIDQKKYDGKSAFIYLGNKYKNKKNFYSLSKNSNLDEAASNLYKVFRIIKKIGYKKIQISKISNKGSGIAINDRIRRASKS